MLARRASYLSAGFIREDATMVPIVLASRAEVSDRRATDESH